MLRFSLFASAALLAVMFLGARTSPADVIELSNGDTIHARVLQITEQSLKIRHEIFGEVDIPRDRVRGIVLGKVKNSDAARPGTPTGKEQKEEKQETPKEIIDRLVNKDFGPQAVAKLAEGAPRQSTPEDVVEQLRVEGVDPKLRSSLHLMLPGFGTPEVQNYFNGRVEGLMDGSITIQDIRNDAIDARDQLKEIMDDLGADGSALQGYYSILDNFIQKTTPRKQTLKNAPKRQNNSR